jgi:hypothetical protein
VEVFIGIGCRISQITLWKVFKRTLISFADAEQVATIDNVGLCCRRISGRCIALSILASPTPIQVSAKTYNKAAPSWRGKKARVSYLNCSCPDCSSNLTKTRRIPKSHISYTRSQLSAMSHSRMKQTLSNDAEFKSIHSDCESESDSDLPPCCKLEAQKQHQQSRQLRIPRNSPSPKFTPPSTTRSISIPQQDTPDSKRPSKTNHLRPNSLLCINSVCKNEPTKCSQNTGVGIRIRKCGKRTKLCRPRKPCMPRCVRCDRTGRTKAANAANLAGGYVKTYQHPAFRA